jgi:proprotein convertase subtilisin/kexin type 5
LLWVSPVSFSFSTDYFYVTTYTNNSLMIDMTDPINVVASKATFYLSCAGHCSTCLSSNTSICQTCYTANTGVITNQTYGGFNIMTSDFQCVDVCGTGYYLQSGNCNACVSPCASCTTVDQCITCATGFYLISTNPPNQRCQNSCPNGYFANSITRTCDQCIGSCYSCSSAANLCTACNGTNYLSGSSCVINCPDGTF